MPTAIIFIQIPNNDGGWEAIYKTSNSKFAKFVAKELNGRHISQTSLKNNEGVFAFNVALEQVEKANYISTERIKELTSKFLGKKEKTKEIMINRVSVDLFETIKDAAANRNIPMRAFIIEALEEKLERDGVYDGRPDKPISTECKEPNPKPIKKFGRAKYIGPSDRTSN